MTEPHRARGRRLLDRLAHARSSTASAQSHVDPRRPDPRCSSSTRGRIGHVIDALPSGPRLRALHLGGGALYPARATSRRPAPARRRSSSSSTPSCASLVSIAAAPRRRRHRARASASPSRSGSTSTRDVRHRRRRALRALRGVGDRRRPSFMAILADSGLVNESCMVSPRSSMGEISSKYLLEAGGLGAGPCGRPACARRRVPSTRRCRPPAKLSVWRARSVEYGRGCR